MNLSTHIHRGLVAIALCATISGYAAVTSHPFAAVGAQQHVTTLGTITVTPSPDEIGEDVVYTQAQGKARVTVGEPVTIGSKEALSRLAMR